MKYHHEFVTREQIALLAIAISNVPDGTPLESVARFVGENAEEIGCTREVANLGEAIVAAIVKAAGR